MTRRTFLAAAILVAYSGAAPAEERRLGAGEVSVALTGNTAQGVEPGPEYLQYFDASGTTDYITRSAPPDGGRWRVDADGRYCSQWRDGAWTCYAVWADDGLIVWVSPSGTRYPARMLEGRVTTF